MQSPKRTKFRKVQKGRVVGQKVPKKRLAFGVHGLRVLETGRITARAIESARRAISRALNRTGIVFITTFPQTPISRKPNEVRMGRGKGSLDHWSAAVLPGSVIFEIGGVDRDLAHKALKLASAKLPVKTSIIDTKPTVQDYKQVLSSSSSSARKSTQSKELGDSEINTKLTSLTV